MGYIKNVKKTLKKQNRHKRGNIKDVKKTLGG